MRIVSHVMVGPSSLPHRIPLSKRELAEFSRSFRRAARERGFSPRTVDRYETWALAFVSWCWEHEPGRVSPNRLGAFQRALSACGDTNDVHVGEAMDALAFLFGGARDAHTVLAATAVYDEDARSADASTKRASSGTDIRTLGVGWRGPKGDGASGSAETEGLDENPDDSSSSAPSEDAEEGSSTAELCIQRYQAQIESLHREATEEDVSLQESSSDAAPAE